MEDESARPVWFMMNVDMLAQPMKAAPVVSIRDEGPISAARILGADAGSSA